MSASRKKKQTFKKEKQVENHKLVAIEKIIRTVVDSHETTDIKLKEIVSYCMDKKCNE